jgi:hypothetical protein
MTVVDVRVDRLHFRFVWLYKSRAAMARGGRCKEEGDGLVEVKMLDDGFAGRV